MVVDAFFVGLQISGNGLYFPIMAFFDFFFHFGDEFAVEVRKIVHKIQRVLNFVGDACREFTEGGEFFGLDELGLGGFEG